MTKPKWADRLGEIMDEFDEKAGVSFFGEWPDFLFVELTKAETELARLQWQPITPENLPKVGDEVIRTRAALSGTTCRTTTESVVFPDTAFADYKALRCTHFRPINPPEETA